MPPFRILDLPLDLLRHVAGTLSNPSAIVVACSARDRDVERIALRQSADDYERARWGGEPGLTVREARERLLAWPPIRYSQGEYSQGETRQVTSSDLATRVTSGELLTETYLLVPSEWIHVGLLATLVAFGAKPDVPLPGEPDGMTVLHACATSGHGADVVRLLAKAGADVNAISLTHRILGDTPLARTLHTLQAIMSSLRAPGFQISAYTDRLRRQTLNGLEAAIVLIEYGADERKSSGRLEGDGGSNL